MARRTPPTTMPAPNNNHNSSTAVVPISYGDKMPKTRGRCVSAICVSWKVFTCIFSHVLLVTTVVAYCLLGAKTFEYLEKNNEIEVSAQSWIQCAHMSLVEPPNSVRRSRRASATFAAT